MDAAILTPGAVAPNSPGSETDEMLASMVESSSAVGLPGDVIARFFQRPDAPPIDNFLHLNDPGQESAETWVPSVVLSAGGCQGQPSSPKSPPMSPPPGQACPACPPLPPRLQLAHANRRCFAGSRGG